MLKVDRAPRYRLTSAPLVQAVVQINFPVVPKLQTLDGVAPLLEELSDLLPYLNQQQVQEVTLTAGPAGPAAPSSQSTVLNVFTDGAGWTLQVSVGSATLSVDGEFYEGVDDLKRRLERVLGALGRRGGVQRCDRLGVRYLDLVELAADDWARWFRSEVVGLGHPDLSGGTLTSTLTETRLEVGLASELDDSARPVQGVIRHGVIPAGSVLQGVPPRQIVNASFLFDMDVFLPTPEPFEPSRLTDHFVQLHTELEKVFLWLLTAEGRQHFGYMLVDDGEVSP